MSLNREFCQIPNRPFTLRHSKITPYKVRTRIWVSEPNDIFIRTCDTGVAIWPTVLMLAKNWTIWVAPVYQLSGRRCVVWGPTCVQPGTFLKCVAPPLPLASYQAESSRPWVLGVISFLINPPPQLFINSLNYMPLVINLPEEIDHSCSPSFFPVKGNRSFIFKGKNNCSLVSCPPTQE